VGNRTQIVEHTGRTVDYTYNEVNQLTQEVVSNDPNGNNATTSFTYDAVGNLVTKTIDGTQTDYAYNSNDQLTQKGSITYTYDANGNLIGDGTNSYEYDDQNRLTKVTTPTDTIEYSYDANDNRIAKIVNGATTTYLIDANTPYAQVITETKDGGTTIDYTYGNDLLSQNSAVETLTYITDALGSTRALADSTGNITDNYTYSPYGALLEHLGNSTNEFLFTGEQFGFEDELYYLRARYYNPLNARFMSRDSYDGTIGNPITQNHYAYANSSPAMYVDPSGNVGLIEVQLNMSVQGELRYVNQRMLTKGVQSVAKRLGCEIAITQVKNMVTEGVGIYFFRSMSTLPYVGRTNDFIIRFRAHLGKRLSDLNHIMGRLEFHGMGKKLSQSELNFIEELLIREVDAMTGGNLVGMDNERYNYGGKNPSNGPKDTARFQQLERMLKKKCEGK